MRGIQQHRNGAKRNGHVVDRKKGSCKAVESISAELGFCGWSGISTSTSIGAESDIYPRRASSLRGARLQANCTTTSCDHKEHREVLKVRTTSSCEIQGASQEFPSPRGSRFASCCLGKRGAVRINARLPVDHSGLVLGVGPSTPLTSGRKPEACPPPFLSQHKSGPEVQEPGGFLDGDDHAKEGGNLTESDLAAFLNFFRMLDSWDRQSG